VIGVASESSGGTDTLERPESGHDETTQAATSGANDVVIACRGLTKRYRVALGYEIEALSELDLEVRRGEIFAIVGPNGSGKTTTLKLLLGLIFPSEGEAFILGEPPRSRRAKRRIGFVPEGPFFYQHMSGEEVVRFYGRLCGLRGRDLRDRTEELLKLVGMSKRRDVVMAQCSKGMVQRIGLASALVNDPDVVLMDEPTSGLDPIGAHEIKELTVRLKEAGKTVLLCSHLLEQVEEVCDRIAILHRGNRLAYGPIDEILQVTDLTELVAMDVSPDAESKLEAMSRETRRQAGEIHCTLKADVEPFDALDVVRGGGGELLRFGRVRESLEDAFIRAVMATSEDGGPVSTDAAEADAKSSDDGEDKGADEQDQASEGGEEE
jgi:ABC-2 type transport system ATP-binding protein